MNNKDIATTFNNAMTEIVLKDSMLVKEIINHGLRYIHEIKDKGKFLDDCEKSCNKRFEMIARSHAIRKRFAKVKQ